MKNFLLLAFLVASCQTQKKSIESQYNVATTKLNPIFKDELQKYNTKLFEKQGNGAAIFLKSQIYTLESANDYADEKRDEFQKTEQEVWIASGELKEKKLTIRLGQIFGNQFIQYNVEQKKISTVFSEYYKSDNLKKLNKNDAQTNELTIPLAIAEVELSKNKNFVVGEVIYGKSKIITKPYYFKPMAFDFEYIRREYELYFKFKVRQFDN